ncbi:MAG: hypothetical protein KJZ69_02725 [Phycisphaerales bacterium]|nr:hypothetical protein [Phycisphaerales bacterium]
MSIESRFGQRSAVRLRAAAKLLTVLLLTVGCASSPYRRALVALEEPPDSRLAERIAEVARAHRQALRDVERAHGRLAAATSGAFRPAKGDLDECAAAVDRCRWSMFNLDRMTESLEDLAGAADASPGGQAQARHLAEEFRRVQGLMAAPVESLALALGAVRLAVETQSSAGAHEVSAMDSQALRVEVERVLSEAAVVSASLRSRGASSHGRATVDASN